MSWLESVVFYSEVTYQRFSLSEGAWSANFWNTFWWKGIIYHYRKIHCVLIEFKSKLFMPGCFWGSKWAGHGKLVPFELAWHWPNEFLTQGWTFLLKHTNLQTHLWMWNVAGGEAEVQHVALYVDLPWNSAQGLIPLDSSFSGSDESRGWDGKKKKPGGLPISSLHCFWQGWCLWDCWRTPHLSLDMHNVVCRSCWSK